MELQYGRGVFVVFETKCMGGSRVFVVFEIPIILCNAVFDIDIDIDIIPIQNSADQFLLCAIFLVVKYQVVRIVPQGREM